MTENRPSSPTVTDEMLMQRLAKGDLHSLGELYVRYGQYVESAIWRFYPSLMREEVEDIAQDVFLRIQKLAHRYRPEERFRAWIYKVAVFTARHSRRNAALRLRCLFESGLSVFGVAKEREQGQEDGVALRDTLKKALDRLPKSQWEVILLSEVEGFTAMEIAEILNIKPQAVWTRLSRARSALQEAVSRMTQEPLFDELTPPIGEKS